jgi:hypothetical protein
MSLSGDLTRRGGAEGETLLVSVSTDRGRVKHGQAKSMRGRRHREVTSDVARGKPLKTARNPWVDSA